jgi:ABC-type Fe3+-siderophore transport system permease subunit
MLQRIQTIYLLLAAIISGVLCMYLPYGIDANGVVLYAKGELFLLGIFLGSAILSLISIFLFKNRKLQFVLGRINILLNFILLGVFVYWSLTVSGETQVSEKGIGMIIPVISIVLLVMANKAIKKDENLVKSVDRLR